MLNIFSAMGITVFDLFNEIITADDMKRFLQLHGVKLGCSVFP